MKPITFSPCLTGLLFRSKAAFTLTRGRVQVQVTRMSGTFTVNHTITNTS